MNYLRSTLLSLSVLSFLVFGTACVPQDSGPAAAAPPTQQAQAGTALEQLEGITIKGRAPKTGYDRDEFGPAWADVDRNGCDTRNDILARDLMDLSFREGTKDCVIASGTFLDPYTGTSISFVRGNTTSTAVQIDHVVALSDAWQKGAQQLSAEQRRQFANDPLNLLAADGPTNGAKSDSDAATWLPPNKGFRCEYVARQTAVKAEYGLWMTQAEHDAIATVLSGCLDEPVPVREGTAARAASGAASAGTGAGQGAGDSSTTGGSSTGGTTTPVYANCSAVKAAGAAPIRPGDPGWDAKFDGDGDGVGCTS